MPIHDFGCSTCDYKLYDQYCSRLNFIPPTCPKCDSALNRLWSTNRMHRTFESFIFDADNGEKVQIDSMSKLREVERKSEERYRQGAGRPYIFRQYSQNNSNMDSNSFGKNDQPTIEKIRNGRQHVTVRRRD